MKLKSFCLYAGKELFAAGVVGVFSYAFWLGLSITIDNYKTNHPQRHPCVAEVERQRSEAYKLLGGKVDKADVERIVDDALGPLEQECLNMESTSRKMRDLVSEMVSPQGTYQP